MEEKVEEKKPEPVSLAGGMDLFGGDDSSSDDDSDSDSESWFIGIVFLLPFICE